MGRGIGATSGGINDPLKTGRSFSHRINIHVGVFGGRYSGCYYTSLSASALASVDPVDDKPYPGDVQHSGDHYGTFCVDLANNHVPVVTRLFDGQSGIGGCCCDRC